jgi:hypothetical protein
LFVVDVLSPGNFVSSLTIASSCFDPLLSAFFNANGALSLPYFVLVYDPHIATNEGAMQ